MVQHLYIRVGNSFEMGGRTNPECTKYDGPPPEEGQQLVTTLTLHCDEDTGAPMKGRFVTIGDKE